MQQDRSAQLQLGLRIEVVTVIWMMIEMAVSILTGIAAGSVALIAFGVDSLIELVGGGMLLWRLSVEARGEDTDRVARAEHRSAYVVAIGLSLLCVYVLAAALWGLITRAKPEASPLGIVVSAAAVLMMPYLAMVKRQVATRIQSAALAGDAMNSITCGYMAGTVLFGLVFNALFGWWWADDVAALVFLVWLVRETVEAFQQGREGAEH